jgi:aspartate carbamoyltransferase catalytic subunit
MERLGGKIIGFAETASTSVSKGESLYDAVKIVGQYVDVIALRHPKEGAARLAAEATDKPVINGGDGANQHPTQTLLDLFTIRETQKKLNNLSVALVGDLKYGRTVHSLSLALSLFNVRLYFVAPSSLQIPDYILGKLKKREISYSLHEELEKVIPGVDILYMTRIQKERFPDPLDYEKVKNVYVLTLKHLERARKNLRILHPLPRVNEIAVEVDKIPYAYYFQQAQNGLYVRQALLALVLGAIK